MTRDRGRRSPGCNLEAFLNEPGLGEGQRRRLRLFQGVEEAVSGRVEQLCARGGLDVTDAAVLIVSASARALILRGPASDDSEARPPGVTILLGHRERLYGFLHAALPPAEDTAFDPFEDLLEPSPHQCVRVLVVDDESITVLSYGAFVTLSLELGGMPEA
jgi:hypothetical protein